MDCVIVNPVMKADNKFYWASVCIPFRINKSDIYNIESSKILDDNRRLIFFKVFLGRCVSIQLSLKIK